MNRRLFLGGVTAGTLTACSSHIYLGDAIDRSPLALLLGAAEAVDYRVIATRGLARTYHESDVDVIFRQNGLPTPADANYADLLRDRFARYRLVVDGLTDAPQTFSLERLRTLARTTHITRHDCVEGWSAIGKWRGVPLLTILALARPTSSARYAIFHCFDRDETGTPYYESLDLAAAAHPQALLALDLNDWPLDADHGAPLRLRVPTQLGYKSAKWIRRIELAATLSHAYRGNGGYWEDLGYEWYAGI